MLSHSILRSMRVLCLTMLPDGGAMTPALMELGYTPYNLRASFQQGHASNHPIEWSNLLDGKKSYDKKLFSDYDAFVGPPATMVYDAILKDCPAYTKVILVEEPDKATWAQKYDAYITKLEAITKKTYRSKISVAFENMLSKMVVRGDEDGKRAQSRYSYRQSTDTASSPPASKMGTSTSSDLRRALAAAGAKQKDASSTAAKAEKSSEGDEENEAPAAPVSPRARALELYEESVRMSVPPSRLLVYRYGEGWEPLCAFLEKPVPSEPFPPYDDGLRVLGNLHERIERARALTLFLAFICLAAIAINVLPRLTFVTGFFTDLAEDYRIAFGADDTGSSNAAAAARARSVKSEADAFEETVRSRGGIVRQTSPAKNAA